MTEQEQELRGLYRRLKGLQVDVTRLFRRMPWEASPGNAMGLGVGDPQLTDTWTTQTTPEAACKRLFVSDDVCSASGAVFRVSWTAPLPWVDHPDNNWDFDVNAIVQASLPVWDCNSGSIRIGDHSSYPPDSPPMTPGWAASSAGCVANSNTQTDALVTFFRRTSLSYKVALQLRVGNYDFESGSPSPIGGLADRYFFEINAGTGLYMNSLTNVGYAELGDLGPPLAVGGSRRLDYWTPFSGSPSPGTAEYVTLTRIS